VHRLPDAAQMDVLKSGAMNQPLRARQQSTGIWTGRNNRIHPSASLTAPVLIGSNTWIDRGVELGPEVVVGSNVMIRSQTQVRHSTILDNTYLGQMLYIENKAVQYDLMVDAQSGEHIRLADPLLAGQSLPSEFGGTIRRALRLCRGSRAAVDHTAAHTRHCWTDLVEYRQCAKATSGYQAPRSTG
jgi:NDP-sugar pyrophosphorylase family protein